jgi:hypothetical protein
MGTLRKYVKEQQSDIEVKAEDSTNNDGRASPILEECEEKIVEE